jgi:hypothetical protein
MMPSSRRIAPHLLSALLLSIAVVVTAAASPVAAGSGSRKACKLLKPKQIEKVLGAEAQRSKVEGTQVAGAESCAFDVGPGLGEPGGGIVVVTYYSGPIAPGIAADVETREEPLAKGVVWDPLVEVAYVIKADKVVGVNVSYTNRDPSTEELRPDMAKLARAAFKRT